MSLLRIATVELLLSILVKIMVGQTCLDKNLDVVLALFNKSIKKSPFYACDKISIIKVVI